MRLLCLFGFHKRSRSHAHRIGSTYESQCKHCSAPMVKLHNGRWRTKPVKRSNAPLAD